MVGRALAISVWKTLGMRGVVGGGDRGSSSLLGPVDPSFRALSGRLKFTVRRHKSNKDLTGEEGVGREEGAPVSYLRLIDFVYHSTLGGDRGGRRQP